MRRGLTLTRTYDGDNRLLTEALGTGLGALLTQHFLDGDGNEVETVDPRGLPTWRTFDGDAHWSRVTHGAG